ncbi:MAG: ABC transporter substrate-binding protein, partial [Solirubrobacterales bacterium]|nr:ABC transporter substrate-binding protein [Solirubrobacterales bacterium]
MSSYSSHRGRRYAAAALVTVAIAALLSACGSSSSGSSSSKSSTLAADTKSAGSSSGTPFRVLWICPASGPLAAAGNAELTGMEAAVTYVNSHGGVLGHKVELKTVDDGGAGTRAVSAAEQALASGTQYNLLYNGCFTQDGVPAAATFAKTPAVQFAPLPDQLVKSGKYPYAFLSGSLLSAPELGIATELKNKGLTKFAILTGDDPSGQTGA